jgi:hypothetical protein
LNNELDGKSSSRLLLNSGKLLRFSDGRHAVQSLRSLSPCRSLSPKIGGRQEGRIAEGRAIEAFAATAPTSIAGLVFERVVVSRQLGPASAQHLTAFADDLCVRNYLGSQLALTINYIVKFIPHCAIGDRRFVFFEVFHMHGESVLISAQCKFHVF